MIKLILCLNGFNTIARIEPEGIRKDKGENLYLLIDKKIYKIETNGDTQETVFLLQWADEYGNIVFDLRNYELTEVDNL